MTVPVGVHMFTQCDLERYFGLNKFSSTSRKLPVTNVNIMIQWVIPLDQPDFQTDLHLRACCALIQFLKNATTTHSSDVDVISSERRLAERRPCSVVKPPLRYVLSCRNWIFGTRTIPARVKLPFLLPLVLAITVT